jgi:hypothetical protein
VDLVIEWNENKKLAIVFDKARMGYPFNRTYYMLSRWATRTLARTIRDPWVNSRRGSGPMRTAWTTWSGYDGLMASLVRLAVAMVAGDWVMGVSNALSAATAPR